MNLTIFSPMLHLIERFDDFLKFFYFIHNFKVNRWVRANKDAKIFICKVRAPAQSFVLPSYTMDELRNQHVSIG